MWVGIRIPSYQASGQPRHDITAKWPMDVSVNFEMMDPIIRKKDDTEKGYEKRRDHRNTAGYFRDVQPFGGHEER